jgi:site-specific DNA recombinase
MILAVIYISASLLTSDRSQSHHGMRIPAGDIEGLVRDRLRRFFSSRAQMAEALAPLELDARAFDAALHKASELSQRWLAVPHIELTRIVRQIVERATVSADGIELRLDRGKLAITLTAKEKNQPPDTELIILSIEARLCRAGKGKRLIIENCATPEINAGLVEMIREAFKIRGQLLSESADDSVEAMSARLGINKHRLTCLIRLSYLAPEIVRALLEGRHPIEMTPTRLLRLSRDLPLDWKDQRQFLGFRA